MAERLAAGVALDLVIERVEDGSVVGEVGLAEIEPARPAAVLGYWLAAEGRGQGIATEAVDLLAGWALGDGGFVLLAARCHPANPRSAAVLTRAGFHRGPSHPDGHVLYARHRGGARVERSV